MLPVCTRSRSLLILAAATSILGIYTYQTDFLAKVTAYPTLYSAEDNAMLKQPKVEGNSTKQKILSPPVKAPAPLEHPGAESTLKNPVAQSKSEKVDISVDQTPTAAAPPPPKTSAPLEQEENSTEEIDSSEMSALEQVEMEHKSKRRPPTNTIVSSKQQNSIDSPETDSEECSVDAINSTPVGQDDPCVVKILREEFIRPPSPRGYRLQHPDTKNPSMGQAQSITSILRKKRGGFFIECGALDGETRSNTLYLEKELGWTGVLIEADPKNFNKVLQKHRKAWAVPACLSKTPRPQVVTFHQEFNRGRISTGQQKHRSGFVRVQCFPIYSILVALNRTTVDYFSLDIEGDELSVLKTIPWDKVDIRTLSVEFIHDKEGKEAIRSYMTRQGYKVMAEVTHPLRLANDFIFAKVS